MQWQAGHAIIEAIGPLPTFMPHLISAAQHRKADVWLRLCWGGSNDSTADKVTTNYLLYIQSATLLVSLHCGKNFQLNSAEYI